MYRQQENSGPASPEAGPYDENYGITAEELEQQRTGGEEDGV